ncbi:MAG: PQQ-dependent sugar dehydrogenase [Bacteroidota bacterium]
MRVKLYLIYYLWVSCALFFLSSCNSSDLIQRTEKKVLLIADDFSQNYAAEVLKRLETKESFVNVHSQTKFHKLRDKDVWSYSALVLVGKDLKSMSPYELSMLERYVQSGGGIVLLNSRLEQNLTWPWYEEFKTSQTPTTNSVKVNDVAGPNEKEKQSYDGGRIAQSENPGEEELEDLIRFAIGNNSYSLSAIKSESAPQENRFTRKVLDDKLIEPMELCVFPDDKILFIERRGKMKLYDPTTEKTRLIHNFDVCTSGNYEDGLLGLTIDPDFARNRYIYLYYSPGKECEKAQYLSRFTFPNGDSLNLASEKVILKVPVQRETCCHSGGSVTFGPDGNLWLSTGDNTSSKESNGYSPLDERPGRGPFDAQKSSANTNDLRGKVIRIKPNKYGSYDIPEGNLFPKDGSKGRPEIYAMGARNPFRIAVDHKTGYVYWGDVGPDAGLDGEFGPQSYDEFNQAREPGYFGWPYFMADNKAFPDRDFTNDKLGGLFDPAKPFNNSPHNTGVQNLPPAQAAYIWYPKQASKEFPMLGKGSNSAMAGPIYHRDMYAENSNNAFPPYYEGKWFIYEWARSWIKAVTFDEQGYVKRIEPFLTEMPLSKPIEMEFGPDGSMYILEYGKNYFADNPDARLIKLEYAGSNRKPVALVKADTYAGAAPLTVTFDASDSYDFDEEDSIKVEWFITQQAEADAKGLEVTHTFESPGIYVVQAKVIDSLGAFVLAPLTIQVGNAAPKVEIDFAANKSFFKSGASFPYKIKLEDREDAEEGKLIPTDADIRFLYLEDAEMLERMSLEEVLDRGTMSHLAGQKLIANSDCATCHGLKIKSVGPSYFAIADRYRNQYDMVGYLASKIISGGNGNWGEKIMAGHPQHTLEECSEMVRYILSLDERSRQSLNPNGRLNFNKHSAGQDNGIYILSVSYTDKGKEEFSPLSTRKTYIMRNSRIPAREFDEGKGVSILVDGPNRDIERVKQIRNGSWIAFKGIDLTSISEISVNAKGLSGGKISIRIDSPEGEEIGAVLVRGTDWSNNRANIKELQGFYDLYLVFENKEVGNKTLMDLDTVEFIF